MNTHQRYWKWLNCRPWAWLALIAALVAGGVFLFLRTPSTTTENELRWGGDATGGEPYLIYNANGEPGGFEGEIANYLGKKLGRPARFVQRNWATLPQDLKRGDIDVILNGYEWFAQREQAMTSTIPYFAYRLRLIVRRDSPIQNWADLRRKAGRKKLRLGVLRDSAAERYLKEQYADDVEVESYDEEGVTGVMTMVVGKTLAATVQDAPAASWYLKTLAKEYQPLHVIGEAIKPTKHNYYVLFVRKNDDALRQQLDDALREGLEDGSLQRILEKYDLWDAKAGLLDVGRTWPPPEVARRRPLGWFAGQLAWASVTTIALAATSFPLAMALGLMIAIGRLYGPRWLAWPMGAYVELIRGTPLLLQLSVVYYLLPEVGLNLSAFWAGVLGLAINYAAYEAEIYRAGLLAVPRGQMEAALSLGMSPATALWRIVVPQAVRTVVPPVTNDFIALFKDTSICAAIAVTELTARYRGFAVNNPVLIVELGLMTGCLYLLMSYPLSLLSRRLERKQQRALA